MMVTPKISGSCGSIAIDEASGMTGSPLIQGHQQPSNALLCRIAIARDRAAFEPPALALPRPSLNLKPSDSASHQLANHVQWQHRTAVTMKLTASTLSTCAVLPVLPALQTYEPLLHAVLCCCLLYNHKMYPGGVQCRSLASSLSKRLLCFKDTNVGNTDIRSSESPFFG